MKVSKGKLVDGKLVATDTIEVNQNKLTSDCWLIQFRGLSECENCDLKNTSECGGGETLNKLMTKKIKGRNNEKK